MSSSAPREPSRAVGHVVVPHVPRRALARSGERFVGAQVPAENPEHWIAERAPPSCAD